VEGFLKELLPPFGTPQFHVSKSIWDNEIDVYAVARYVNTYPLHQLLLTAVEAFRNAKNRR
jgi:hypothetical protein